MSDYMFERVAKAIDNSIINGRNTVRDIFLYAIETPNGPSNTMDRQFHCKVIDEWLTEITRNAINAMREPTTKMLKAAENVPEWDYPAGGDPHMQALYAAMIGAASE